MATNRPLDRELDSKALHRACSVLDVDVGPEYSTADRYACERVIIAYLAVLPAPAVPPKVSGGARSWMVYVVDGGNEPYTTYAREILSLLTAPAGREGDAPSIAKAKHAALAALYFADSSDYQTALWDVLTALDSSFRDVEDITSEMYDDSLRALPAPRPREEGTNGN